MATVETSTLILIVIIINSALLVCTMVAHNSLACGLAIAPP